ncbi:unnamed protein product [Ilex paraguariensis]|uniref:Enhancer of polycomb-like protein n=1 Tax=Ilex paraguariensis TaxID=185542 RepID=A0ABC8UZW7_9AQUA
MENSVGKSDGAEISKKTRSVDLQSLYKSRVLKEGHNKRKNSAQNNDEVKKKKRNSRKEVALTSIQQAGKKSKKSLGEVYVDGVSSGSGDVDRALLGLSDKLSTSNGSNGISIGLDGNGNSIRIPKRPRGFVGRKKVESNRVSKPSGLYSSGDHTAKLNGESENIVGNQGLKTPGSSSSKARSGDEIVKLHSDSGGEIVSSKVSQKSGVDDVKGSRTARVRSARHAKEEAGHLVVDNDDAPPRRRQSKHRKKNGLASGNGTVVKQVEPPLVNPVSNRDGFQDDDDEENLEANAARMLSSRFDPSCTGFSLKTRSSASHYANGSSSLIHSGQRFGQGANFLAGSELASADSAASRVLRPRKHHNEKGLSRKRRHFYEILSTDLDVYWVLNRRIKVFWPLDESWYYGLVKDYDPERKLHHIKYDDRDEEWIDLQHERYKLLLLPSEVPGKVEPRKSAMGDKGKAELTSDDESYVGSYMDSEPIISWLARSSRRVKSSPSGTLKKQKTSHPSTYSVPPLSDKIDDARLDMGLFGIDMSAVNCNSAFPDRSINGISGETYVLESTTSSKDSELPVVYFRRRYRKKDSGWISTSVNGNASRSVPGSVFSLAPVVDTSRTSKESNVSLGWFKPYEHFWSIDDDGLLKLSMPLVESREFRLELCLSVPPVLNVIFGLEDFWWLHAVLLLQFGTVVSLWPKVHLEMLFLDNNFGLRFFLFEGCLKNAVAFVFLVLQVFHQPHEQGKYVNLQFPVSSIRFKLSCLQDFRKKHVFAFCSFSNVKCSKWLHLDHKLQQHCLLVHQLPLSECTYDNIRALNGVCNQLDINSVGGEPSAFQDILSMARLLCVVRHFNMILLPVGLNVASCTVKQGLQKKSALGIMAVGVSKESCNTNMNCSSSNYDLKRGKLPPFALSFTASPTFFLGLHLKLLRSIACMSLQDHEPAYSLQSESTCLPIADDSTPVEYCSENAPVITPESNLKPSSGEVACSGWLSSARPQLGTYVEPHLKTDNVLASNDGDSLQLSENLQNSKPMNVAGTYSCSNDSGENAIDVIVQSQDGGCNDLVSQHIAISEQPIVPKDHNSPGMSNDKSYSGLNGLSVEIPSFDQVQRPVDESTHRAQQASELDWNTSDGFDRSPNPTGPRSLSHRNRNSSSSSSFGDLSHVRPDGKRDFIRNGFGNGPKKPRTQVHYMMPFGGFDFSSKHMIHNRKGLPYKRIRRAKEKKTSDGSKVSRRNLEFLACDANVLVTLGDRGWRECGGRVMLELADQSEWKLAVKLSGTTKYSYKVHHVLQPGSTNRYTHAMMWKGGKDWVLEFPDRSQWMLFKEMHEECYNRNIRAASVKNIPIPGVRLIEESDDDATEVPFVHSSSKYFRQVETDVEMAMDVSRILYDLDSDDEQWIFNNSKSSHSGENESEYISEELLEKTMDMFEKFSYAQQRDHFTADEIEELMVGFGPKEVIKVIYEHWRLKRQNKGMPLIRQLQVPSTLFSHLMPFPCYWYLVYIFGSENVANFDGT